LHECLRSAAALIGIYSEKQFDFFLEENRHRLTHIDPDARRTENRRTSKANSGGGVGFLRLKRNLDWSEELQKMPKIQLEKKDTFSSRYFFIGGGVITLFALPPGIATVFIIHFVSLRLLFGHQ